MKLRLRENSLRLRVNRRELDALVSGQSLEERVKFPGTSTLSYSLLPTSQSEPAAAFDGSKIQVLVPSAVVEEWAHSKNLGIYVDFASENELLKVAIEKDLECLHGPEEERDPDAFPRQ